MYFKKEIYMTPMIFKVKYQNELKTFWGTQIAVKKNFAEAQLFSVNK
jgi:hypothetical protein